MNLNAIEACKEIETYIKELPEVYADKMMELIDSLKRVALSADEYVETIDEPLKSNMKRHLNTVRMRLKIREVCKEDNICDLLSEEYTSSTFGNDDEKEIRFGGIRERHKEIYEQHADKIAAYREELGLANPFSEFKPY